MRKALSAICATALVTVSAQENITAYRNGRDLLIRSEFSPQEDLVISITRVGNENAYLIPKTAAITEYASKGRTIHQGGDEFPATAFDSYGFLSGNHGSIFARTLLIPNHGMTDKDIGTPLTEKDGYTYRILQVPDKDHILIHPDGTGDTLRHGFRAHKDAKLFRDGKEFPFQKSDVCQLYPLNRITEFEFLADGKTPLPDKTEVKCRFLDHLITHDVISPLAVMEWVRKNPGKKPEPELQGKWAMTYADTEKERAKYPEYMKLDSLVTYRNLYRYEPRGASVLYRKAVFHAHLPQVNSLDIMFVWSGEIAKKKNEEFYIPKLKPVKVKRTDGAPDVECDFSAIYKMPTPMPVNGWIEKKDCLNPEDMPDRFIRIVGDTERELGIALGYSLFMGCTAKENKGADRNKLYHLWNTKKMYPYVYSLSNIKPGKTMETVCYKQYFNPKLEPDATDFYWHKQGDSIVVYLDFHKTLAKKTVPLPSDFAGKKITVLEKTPSMTLHSGKTVPPEGVSLSVKDNYGYLVLKLD